jgi:hypothetical protein
MLSTAPISSNHHHLLLLFFRGALLLLHLELLRIDCDLTVDRLIPMKSFMLPGLQDEEEVT